MNEGKKTSKTPLLENSKEKIDIVIVTFNRLEFLKKTIDAIIDNTRYPYRIIVVDNNSSDGTCKWLVLAKGVGLISEYLLLEENVGLAAGLSEGFKLVKSEYFIATQDDLLPPKSEPCWLERMVVLFKKNEKEYGGIAMIPKRMMNRDINEYSNLNK